jgi:hypothetical protein
MIPVSARRVRPIIVRVYMTRGARLWLVFRAAVSFVLLLGGSDPIRVSPIVSSYIVALTIGIGLIDLRRQRETIFVANLGLSPIILVTMLGAPAIAGEILLHIAGAFTR